MSMWSVGGIAGLISMVTISAYIHLGVKEDQDQGYQHHVQDSEVGPMNDRESLLGRFLIWSHDLI